MANISANQWDLANFKIKDDHIMVVKPINGITKITFPAPKLMSWYDALFYSYSIKNCGCWKIPTIEELQTVFKIYGLVSINNPLWSKPKTPVWSLNTESLTDPCAEALDFNTGKPLPTNPDKNSQLEVICVSYC